MGGSESYADLTGTDATRDGFTDLAEMRRALATIYQDISEEAAHTCQTPSRPVRCSLPGGPRNSTTSFAADRARKEPRCRSTPPARVAGRAGLTKPVSLC